MSRTISILAVVFCLATGATLLRAETFHFNDGTSVNGTIASSDQNGAVLKDEAGNYNPERISWSKFTQEDLKRFKENPKLAPLVEPFIEDTTPEASANPITVKPVTTLDRPQKSSVLGAMFHSSVGITVLFLVWLANIYAGFEVARFRQRPPAVPCIVSAVLPFIGPIIFFFIKMAPPEPEYVAPDVAAAQQQTFTVASVPAEGAEPEAPGDAGAQGGLHLSKAGHAQTGNVPATQTFARGQFMFNRRFFETKFPGFFGMVKRGGDEDLVLVFKTARGEYVAQRIARISANELHAQVQQGEASADVMIPFNDIKEIQLKHKDA